MKFVILTLSLPKGKNPGIGFFRNTEVLRYAQDDEVRSTCTPYR